MANGQMIRVPKLTVRPLPGSDDYVNLANRIFRSLLPHVVYNLRDFFGDIEVNVQVVNIKEVTCRRTVLCARFQSVYDLSSESALANLVLYLVLDEDVPRGKNVGQQVIVQHPDGFAIDLFNNEYLIMAHGKPYDTEYILTDEQMHLAHSLTINLMQMLLIHEHSER